MAVNFETENRKLKTQLAKARADRRKAETDHLKTLGNICLKNDQIAKLTEALEFYAHYEKNYLHGIPGKWDTFHKAEGRDEQRWYPDQGEIADTALGGEEDD